MKDEERIDEMLSSYMDGELDERAMTELKRLLQHEAHAARQFDEMSKLKDLLTAMPAANAPADTFEAVKSRLERNVLLDDVAQYSHVEQGRRHLLIRRTITAAAILVPIAALIIVVFNIFFPDLTPEPFIAEKPIPKAVERIEIPETAALPEPVVAAVADEVEVAPQPQPLPPVNIPFAAELEITAASPTIANAFIGKILYDSSLLDSVTIKESQQGYTEYSLDCSRDQAGDMLVEFKTVWSKFSSARLKLSAETSGSYVIIDNVTPQQLLDVFEVDDSVERLAVARDMSQSNKMIAADDGQAESNPSELPAPPKPFMTSDVGREQKLNDAEDVQPGETVDFTIKVFKH